MPLAIKVENLSKAYQLGQIGTGTLSQDLERWFARIRGKEDPFLRIGEKNDHSHTSTTGVVWSLKDLNFEIQQGEAIGIIGKNGAGKSTLLKILSQVTAPTLGTVKAKGRIASLLEVGTGFHPELTGRENIFLNGAILGMRKKEIARKFDEIVSFSGVERYIDTPVKRYSSGMYVRLAFAVAAHLESEILVVDEVLAVGDAEFQKKCLGKMQDVSAQEGRTVLFVSHNMAAIQSFCTKAIRLHQGAVAGNGAVDDCIRDYLRDAIASASVSLADRADRSGSGELKFRTIHLEDSKGGTIGFLITGQDFKFVLNIESKGGDRKRNVFVALGINDGMGNRITNLNNEATGDAIPEVPEGSSRIEIAVTHLPLMPGAYDLAMYMSVNGEVTDWIQNAFSFTVEGGDFYSTGKLIPSGQGTFLMNHKFLLE